MLPPYIKKWETVQERHEENRRIFEKLEYEKYKIGLDNLNNKKVFTVKKGNETKENITYRELMKLICTELVGLDVYYEDKSNESQTNFCKCTPSLFPFMLALEYDDIPITKDYSVKYLSKVEELKDLYELNFRQDIVNKREIRQKLRCLNG